LGLSDWEHGHYEIIWAILTKIERQNPKEILKRSLFYPPKIKNIHRFFVGKNIKKSL
jgi:hypothetical protein